MAGLLTGYLAIVWHLTVAPLLLFHTATKVVNGRPTSSKAECVTNLKIMAGAKAEWALLNRKQPSDVPADSDLFGADRYIRAKPACPAGGKYSINPVSEKPTCTIPGHAY